DAAQPRAARAGQPVPAPAGPERRASWAGRRGPADLDRLPGDRADRAGVDRHRPPDGGDRAGDDARVLLAVAEPAPLCRRHGRAYRLRHHDFPVRIPDRHRHRLKWGIMTTPATDRRVWLITGATSRRWRATAASMSWSTVPDGLRSAPWR